MAIKSFSLEYDAVNGRNTFTNGDQINGRVIVETYRETKIQSLVIIAKGKAKVSLWTVEIEEEYVMPNKAERKYYEIRQVLKEQRRDGICILGPGRHAFLFALTVPDGEIPSSFEERSGKIVHKLKAELKQPMRIKRTTEAHFNYVCKADMTIPGLLEPQCDSIYKSIKVIGSGNLSLFVQVNKMGFHPGDLIRVTAEIKNNASRSVKPKLVLCERKSFNAQGERKTCQRELLREKYEAVETSSNKTVTAVFIVPNKLPASILNCSIIALNYFLKVYLDIKYYPDPEITLPIIILPNTTERNQSSAVTFGFESSAAPHEHTTGNTSQQASHQLLDPPPSYESYPLYPSVGDKIS